MRARRLAAGCGVVFVILVLLAGCGLASIYSRLPAGEHPDVDFESAEISAARAAVVPELEAELDAVLERSGFRPVSDRARLDRCEAGHDDFTRQDRYAYSCRMEVRQIVEVPAPFPENASRLGEALVEGDCPDGTDTDRALRELTGDVLDLSSSRGDCTPGVSVGAPEIEGWLPAQPTADELERARLVRGGTERCWASIEREHCDVQRLDLNAALAAASPDARALAILVARDGYHQVPWDCPWPASWFADRCRS
jgi:hypothetical protein